MSSGIVATISVTSGNIVLGTVTYGTVAYNNVHLTMTPGTYGASLNSTGTSPTLATVNNIPYTVLDTTLPNSAFPLGTLNVGINITSGTTPTSFTLNTIATNGGVVGTKVTTTGGNMVFPPVTFVNTVTNKTYPIDGTPSGGINIVVS